MAAMPSEPGHLQFDISDLLEEDTENKHSFDVDESRPLNSSKAAPSRAFVDTYYRPVEDYEGYHRYDPRFQWTSSAERKIVRKIDLRICVFVCILFLALSVDRGTITQRPSTDVLQEFGITLEEYHTGQSVYFLSYLIAELPSQLIAKAVGTEVTIPLQLIAWSLATGAQTGIDGRWSFWVIRSVIGVFEGGFVPSCVLYLSYYYTTSELPKRLSWFWACYHIGAIASTIVAWFVLHTSGLREMPGWQWLSETEGLLTFFIGCFAWLYLPPSPTRTASKFRGEQGWFSEAEEKIMVNRIVRDDPTKGDMRSNQALTLREIFNSLWDYHMWPIYLLGLSWHMALFPTSQYIIQSLRAIGYGALTIDLMVLPTHFIWTCNLLVFTWVSEWLNERLLLSALCQIWILPMLIAMVALPTDREMIDNYVLTMLLGAQPYVHAILTGLVSRNSGSVRTRTVSAAIYNMCMQASTVLGIWVYRHDPDKAFYFQGNRIFILVTAYNIFLFIGVKWFYVYCNQRRREVWEKMSEHDQRRYMETTTDEGNKRLDFRFKH